MIKKIFLVLPHVIIVQALFLSVMWVLDQLNPRMEFLGNGISDMVLAVFLVLVLINGIWNVWNQCRCGEICYGPCPGEEEAALPPGGE